MNYVVMKESGYHYVGIDCRACGNDFDTSTCLDKIRAQIPDTVDARIVMYSNSNTADTHMRVVNTNGDTLPPFDGGISSLAVCLSERHIKRNRRISIDTDFFTAYAEAKMTDGKINSIEVDLGPPVIYSPVAMPLTFTDVVYDVTRISLAGEPHSICFLHELNDTLVTDIAPEISNRLSIPTHSNVELARVNRREDLTVRAWKHQAGEVGGSGIAACATVIAGTLVGRTERKLMIHMPSGDYQVTWLGPDDRVTFSVPAFQVGSGVVE